MKTPMNTNMYRTLPWMLLAVLGCMINTVSADTFGLFTYTDNGTSITITGYPTDATGAVDIPSTINGESVTSIGDSAFTGCTGLSSITIPDNITSIGNSAFYNCTNLTTITIPGSVTSIGDWAFDNCSSLISAGFLGNAPSLNWTTFYDTATGFTVYYQSGALDFTSPTWDGYASALFGAPTVANPTYSKITDTSATLGGNVTGNGGYAISALGVVFAPTAINPNPQIDGTGVTNITAIGTGGVFTVDISGLTPGTQYSFAAYATNSLGTSYSTNGTFIATYVPFTYTVTDVAVTITGYIGSDSTVTIPSTINGLPVTSIGSNAFSYCTGLTSITIPDSVTSIGDSAFFDCANLTTITIPNGVTSIGSGSFEYCTSLTSITIPNSVTSIGDYAFYDCTSLTSITIPSGVTSIGDEAFAFCGSLTSITIPDSVTSIGNLTFYDCSRLISVGFLGNAPSLGWGTFYDTPSGFSVYYQSWASGFTSPTWDGYASALYGAPTVLNPSYTNITNTSATLGGDVAGNGGVAVSTLGVVFSPTATNPNPQIGGTGVTKVTGTGTGGVFTVDISGLTPGTQYSFAAYATNSLGTGYSPISSFIATYVPFTYTVTDAAVTITSYIGGDSTVTVPATINGLPVTTIGDFSFLYNNILTSITIPESVTSIGNYAFYGCNSLIGITIPNGVTSIGNYAFYDCFSLSSITIPDGVTNIGHQSFAYCSGLTNISIPSSVTSIGDGALYYCTNLTSVSISSGFTSIGYETFAYCSSLSSMTIPESVTSIGDLAFSNCTNLTTITIPDSVISIGSRSFQYCTSLTSINIPSNVTSIGDYAFYDSTNLTAINVDSLNANYSSLNGILFNKDKTTLMQCPCGVTNVTIPPSITSIGDYAFYNCAGLTNISIPDNVNSIGNYAFYECTGLVSITITANVTSIGDWAFYNCTSLAVFTIPNSIISIGNGVFYGCISMTGITIPNSVTSIGNYAFYGCSGLTSITIPDSVTYIGSLAFYECSSLISVGFLGNAPYLGWGTFWTTAPGFTVYYQGGASDFTSPTWNGYASALFGAPTVVNPTYAKITDTSATLGGNVSGNGGVAVSALGVVFAPTATNPNPQIDGAGVTNVTAKGAGGVFTIDVSGLTSGTQYSFAAYATNSLGTSYSPTSSFIATYVPFTYTVTDVAVKITGYIGSDSTATIPATINGLPVTSIGDFAFQFNTGLTSITIPNSVSSIGNYAFYGCTALTGITFPDSVTSIGDYAFYDCTGLSSITIPNGVTSIGNGSFEACTGLTSASFLGNAPSLGWGTFWVTAPGFTVYYQSGALNFTSPTWDGYASAAFSAPTVINPSYTNITYTSATLGGNVTVNGGETISALGVVFAPTATNSNPQIGGTGVTNVTGIGTGGVFTVDVSGLSPNTLYSFAAYATNSTGTGYSVIGSFTATPFTYSITNGSVTITGYTGSDSSVTIPATIIGLPVTNIGDSAFYNRTDVTGITIPDSVTSIGDWSFGYCTGLTSITIPSSVTNFGNGAFQGCTSLVSITIPDSITSIGIEAFDGCTGLTTITIPSSVASIGVYAFYNCASLTAINVDSLNANFSSLNGILFNQNQTTLIQCPCGLTSVTIPPGVTSIGNGAFSFCVGLTSITIPNSVTNFGDYAFFGCTGLTSISIPNSVTSIGDWAFYKCTSLISAGFLGNAPTLGWAAFGDTNFGFTLYYQSTASGFTSPTWNGYASAIFSVPTIVNPSYGNITYTSATLGGSVASNGGFTVTTQGVVFAPTATNPNPQIGGTGVTNVASTGTGGGSIPSIIGVSSVSQHSIASIAAHPNPQSSGTGVPTVSGIGNQGWFKVNVSGLTPGTQYSFAAYATNSLGTGYSSTGIFTAVPFTYNIMGGAVTITGYTGNDSSVTIPDTINGLPVISIGEWALAYHTGLTSVTIPSSVTSIGDYAFYDCTSLTGINIPDGVTSIGNGTFNACKSLTSISIPSSVTGIKDGAFAWCSSLTSASFLGNAPTTLGSNTFDGTAPGFTVYYQSGASGFTSPTWNGYNAVSIGNSDPVTNWLLANNLPSNTDITTSPNGDGVSLLMDYALNLNPKQNQSGSIPQPVIAGNQMTLSYYAGSTGVTYTVETSADMQTWTTNGVTLSAPDAKNFQTATVPMTGQNLFMRLVARH